MKIDVTRKRTYIRRTQHVLTIFLLCCACYLCWYRLDSINSRKYYDELRQNTASDSRSQLGLTESGNTTDDRLPEIVSGSLLADPDAMAFTGPDFDFLYEINPQIFSWLSIDGTTLSYPVVFPEDNEYYLTHNFEKKWDRHGCLFADADTDMQASCHLLLHGHNMKDGSMFGMLSSYTSQSYLEDHPAICLNTPQGKREYRIFAVVNTKVFRHSENTFKYYAYKNISEKEAFESYIEGITAHALYDTGIHPAWGDSLITLSTCRNAVENGRLIVVGYCASDGSGPASW